MDKKIQKLLEHNKIKYKLLDHRKVYTAFTEAETQHVEPKTVVKTVFLKLSKPSLHLVQSSSPNNRRSGSAADEVVSQTIDSILVAISAKKRVDFKKIAKAINDHALKSYKQMQKNVVQAHGLPQKQGKALHYKKPSPITVKMANEKDIIKKLKTKVGLLSAFSQIYNIPLLFDKKLSTNKKLIVSAGSYTQSIEISTKDFLKIMNGIIGNFTE